jgi:hypothetical protein
MFLHPPRFYLFIGFVVTFGATLRGDSVLNFPRLSFEENTLTSLAIANPTGQSAVVHFTAYGTDGKIISATGFQNPSDLTVAPYQQVAKLVSEIFGGTLPASTIGWFQATSSVDGLTGFFAYLDNQYRFFDGADLPPPAAKIIFNQARLDSGYSTELNIINAGVTASNLQLQLAGSGLTTVSKSLVLPAKGVARLDASSFFGSTAAGPASISVASDAEISGFELVRTPAGDLLGLNARDSEELLSNIYFPQMAVLGSWTTEIGLVNYSTSPVILTISAYKPDGTLYTAGTVKNNPVTRPLAAGGRLREDVASMFGFSGTATLDGWIQVQSTSPAVNGYLSYGSNRSVAAIAAAPQGLTNTLFSHIGTTLGFYTGVAVLNSGEQAANVRILALQANGQLLGSFNTVLAPRQRLSNLIENLIPQAAGQGGGLIWVKSDIPVYPIELFGTANTLANVPPQPAPASYAPDEGLVTWRLLPSLAPVQTGSSQAFVVQFGTGPYTWRVNGLPGGDAVFGTVTTAGVYKAPTVEPAQAVTVTAEGSNQVAGASVDVLQKETLITGLGAVQSVAYLGSLQKIYIAELTAATTSQPTAQGPTSGVSEVTTAGIRIPIINYSNETVSKMISYAASDGKEYLLLAGQTSGRILRLNPTTKESFEVAAGLNQPSAMVIDTLSGDLLVAEADTISIIPKAAIDSAGPTKGPPGPAPRFERALLFPANRPTGISADPCTGDVYFSDAVNSAVQVYVRRTGNLRTIPFISDPRQLIGLSRSGVSCPLPLHLLVVERGRDRILLVLPFESSFLSWVPSRGTTDIAFLPKNGNSFKTDSVLLVEAGAGGTNQISLVRVGDSYKTEVSNPPSTATGISVSITPPSATVNVGALQQFSASVQGASNNLVIWSAAAGYVSRTGVYRAPARSGTYAVSATAVADPRKSARAPVKVVCPSTEYTGANPFQIVTSVSGNVSAGQSGVRAVIVGRGDLTNFARNIPLPTRINDPLCGIGILFRVEGISAQPLLLTQAQRFGDFSGWPALLDPATGAPFTANRIPITRLNDVMALPVLLEADATVRSGNYGFSIVGPGGEVIASGTVTLVVK